MKKTPTTAELLDRLGKKLPPKQCAWVNCPYEDPIIHPLYPGQKYHPEPCAPAAAQAKAEERMARNKSGSGSHKARKKEAEHRRVIAEETAKGVAAGMDKDSAAARAVATLKREYPNLDFGPQHNLPHAAPLRPGDPRIANFMDIASRAPRFSWVRIAEQVDERPATARHFQKYHEKALKGLIEDPAFLEVVDEAMARTGETLNDAAYEEAVIGVERFGVSMGAPVSLGKVRDTKLLSQLLKVSNKDFARANSAAGANIQVNINNGAATVNPDDENNPIFHFTYYETLKLDDDERRQLAAIASKIISGRKNEPVTIDLEPDARTKALMHEAREIAQDVEDLNDV